MLISWIGEIVCTLFVPKGKTAVEVVDRQRLFVVFSAICEFAHPFAPLFIAAAFERISHQDFDLFFADVFGGQVCKFLHVGELAERSPKSTRIHGAEQSRSADFKRTLVMSNPR